MTDDERKKLDYEKTIEYIHKLGDIRFKLLAIVPIASGSAIGLVAPHGDPFKGIIIGALGLFVTLGIIFYDQRNTEIYEKYFRRAKLLEISLGIPPTSKSELVGGPFLGRSARGRKLFSKFLMWHDRGLAFIYASVCGGWVFLFVVSALGLIVCWSQSLRAGLALGVAVLVSILLTQQLHKLDEPNDELQTLDKEIKDLLKKKGA
ncbi:MAG: hypothetical protein ACFFCW_16255 [Candidatus Hodarchaeota archaeon]